MKTNEYLCLKNWNIGGILYFEKDKLYKGKESKTSYGMSVKMRGEKSKTVNFHTGSEYFNIN